MIRKFAPFLLWTVLSWAPAAGAAAVVDPALEPVAINTAPGPEYAEETRRFQGIPGIERAANGRLWATWYAGGPDEPGEGPGNYVVLVTSGDDGKTWSKAKLVIDPPGPVRAYDPCLWHAPDGRLWLFWAQSYHWWDGRSGVWCSVAENSGDEAPRWSAPRRLCNGIMMNKPTVLSTGEWLLPTSVWAEPAKASTPAEYRHNLGSENGANVHVSRDQGASWTLLGQAHVPNRVFDEHSLVERGDGSLWMLVRAAYGIGESVSTDRGKTWSEGKASPIPHVNSRFFIRRLRSGKLLLVSHNPPNRKTRSHLIAHLSDDDGKTWTGGLLIDERPNVSYPDGVQAADGTIYLIYDYARTKEKQIFMASFTEDDVKQGEWKSAQARSRVLVNQANSQDAKPTAAASIAPSNAWSKQAAEDAKQDRTSIPYDGKTPNKLVCDTTLRQLADGSWALFLLAGDDFEPSPKNYVGLTRSTDQGRTWSPLEPVDIGFPREGKTSGQGPTELMVRGARSTLFFSTHSQTWGRDWQSWMMSSDDLCRTWSKPEPVPGRLGQFTFIRNHIVTRDGRILIPFQHYLGPGKDVPPPPAEEKPWHKALRHYVSNPRNGVLISSDGGKSWSEHGNVRLTADDRYHGWAENNIAEMADGRIVMIIRGDRLGGVLYAAESPDGGKTWPEFATKTEIPNPGSKATLYSLGGDTVAMLHNPNPKRRSPLALWISFDGLKTWPYQRVLVPESSDGPKGNLNYPDGFVSQDKQWLHFAFDDNRHRAVHYSAKLPPLPSAPARPAKPGAAKAATPPRSVLDLTLEPTTINTAPGPQYSDEQRDYAMTIGIERTRGGRLWAAWVGGGDSPLAYFVAASSDDNGATWSKPRLVIDPVDTPAPGSLPQSALVGNLWTDPTGKLWLFYDQSLGAFDGRAGVWAITCANPDAETPTWSAPRRLWHGMILNKPTVLKNGEWLLPISLWTRDRIGAPFRDCYRELDPLRMANIFVSTDQGATWTRRGGVTIPKTDFDEHMFVELSDGRLWLLARTMSGIAESFSSDQGRTWSKPEVSTIKNVSARFFLRRLASGRLLLVKNGPIDQRLKSRARMTAFLSDDEGKSWKGGLVLDERNGVSYPDGFQMPDGPIVVSYDRNRAKDREILMARFTEDDVLAGALTSPGSQLKMLVNKARGPQPGGSSLP